MVLQNSKAEESVLHTLPHLTEMLETCIFFERKIFSYNNSLVNCCGLCYFEETAFTVPAIVAKVHIFQINQFCSERAPVKD